MNLWDVVIIALVAGALALAVRHMVRVKRSGGSCCDGNCAGCGKEKRGGNRGKGCS